MTFPDKTTTIALTVVNAILCICGTVENLLVCVVILRNEELQNGLDLLIGNLCFADLAVCTLAQPMYVFYLNKYIPPESSQEMAFLYLSITTMHAVALNLLCIAINRMLAITNPFTNTFIFSKFKILMVICFIWISSICMAVIVLSETEAAIYISQYSHVLIILAFLSCYVRIFWIARKQQRQINIQMQSVIHNHRQVRLQKTNRATKTTLLIVISLMVCFVPDTVFDFYPYPWTDINDVRKNWLFTLLFFSCSLNPLIYMWRTDAFKTAAKRTFRIPGISMATASVTYSGST
ncbi:histamine H2 receptor-like [Exaiptasia diaphana]|uniref:G-protein coupled receptors family 1 profile domain-containing protein n=1 Tax=Exaiptasia diaphana TaxID=2652724 RepID=A0A913XLP1_EXADI|nr:histamine H2 receptor-like [Exaiptasia diaphana]